MKTPDFQNPAQQVRTAEHIGQLIRQKWHALAMTQEELAGLAGVGLRFLSELERGKDTAELGRCCTFWLAWA